MRAADQVPECFLVSEGPFDIGAVEGFFDARREVLLEADPAPLTPSHMQPQVVWDRWREYLAWKANGFKGADD